MIRRIPQSWRAPLLMGLFVLLVYNANGREIEIGDSVPTKCAAGELVLRHTLTLDEVVARYPSFAEWPAFFRTLDGHMRSSHPFLPSVWGALVGGSLHAAGLVDLNRPSGLAISAKLAASLVTTLAVVFAYLAARRRASTRQAVFVALGFGLGTGLWPTVSQTLWQHETAIFGLAGAVWLLECGAHERSAAALSWVGVLLGIAGMGRPQVAPIVMVLAIAAIVQSGRPWWRATLALWPLALLGMATLALNQIWYGHPLGAAGYLEFSRHPETHLVSGSFSATPWVGLAGMLISPNRGLLVFSPVVLVALAGITALRGAAPAAARLRWFVAAGVVELILLSFYSVWWGGYTYGPRYLLDALPLLVPLAAIGTARAWQSRWLRAGAAVLLAWSIFVSAVGAFCYAADTWNTDPEDVDLHHERLWDWHDMEILYCLDGGLNPGNWNFDYPPPKPITDAGDSPVSR